MAMTLEMTDVPTVAAADLAGAMRALIEAGRGAVLLRGLADEDFDLVQAELKRRFAGEPQKALAAFIRFRHMVEVFAARRLKNAVLDRGFAVIAPAIAIASSLRLNAERGFNPQKFTMALTDAFAANVVTLEPRHAEPIMEPAEQLAA